MENILSLLKEKLKDPRWLAISCAVGGLILGLIVGWGIWPVKWSSASAENLRPDLRLDYLRNAVTTYTLTGDQMKAAQAYGELGKAGESTLEELRAAPGFLNEEQINRYAAALKLPAAAVSENATTSPTQPAAVEETPAVTTETGKKSNGLLTLGLVLLGILVVGAYLVYRFFFKERAEGDTKPLPEAAAVRVPNVVPMRSQASQTTPRPAAVPAADFAQPVHEEPKKTSAPASAMGGQPIAQFMTTYSFGDDLYDESFTFDAPNGEFLGESGVSISDLIGVGEPKKICAFDIWLFDKNDVQTVTKVLMSTHAFNNAAIRQRLELRGEPILAQPGRQIVMETATLRLEARIVDVLYGDLPLPEESYFKRCTVDLAIYRR